MTDPARVISLLTDREETIAAAESITGGRLCARLTDGAGASKVFAGGVVSYATEVKVKVLGVPQSLVDEHGVVSGECARSMAEGVRDLLATTYGVSTTGVAGPDTQEGKPVGTVFIGIAGPIGTRVVELSLDGDRDDIQAATVSEAMSALREMMDAVEPPTAGRDPEHPGLG